MKQLFIKQGNVVLKEVEPPVVSEQDVLIQLHYSCISPGTEGATIKATKGSLATKFIRNVADNTTKLIGAVSEHGLAATIDLVSRKSHQLMPLGYSCAGQVVAIGKSVKHIRVGDYVAAASSAHAYHAQNIAIPEGLVVKLENREQCKYASTVALGAIAMHGLRRASLQFGETVCVFGLGLIGQITVQLAKHAGLSVIGIDINSDRLQLAESLGCDNVYHARDDDALRQVQNLTNRYGVDATIITASSSQQVIINQALVLTRQRGAVVLVGDVPIRFDRELCYAKEIDFRLSCSYGPGRYDARYEQENIDYPFGYVRWTERRNMAYYVSLLAQNKINLAPIVSRVCSFEQASVAYKMLEERSSLGVLLAYDHKPKESSKHTNAHKQAYALVPSRVKRDRSNVAIIGGGGFVRIKLLPMLARLPKVSLHTIVEKQQSIALSLSEQYGMQRVHSSYLPILDDPSVDTVVIATPHADHAAIAIDCLKAGKAVFCEKPAAVTAEQVDDLSRVLSVLSRPCYTVDFNRCYAPLIVDLKHMLSSRTTPLSISYRMNAGFIPYTHWQQDTKNRGRIIGEVCHIIDLFCSLVDAQPTSVSVVSVPLSDEYAHGPDTISVQLSFYDGSIASLQYVALGNNAMEKERMELFFDGTSMVLDDYVCLRGYGVPVSANKKLAHQDKGHKGLMSAFIDVAIDPSIDLPIPINRILLTSKVTLIIDELARSGGGTRVIHDS